MKTVDRRRMKELFIKLSKVEIRTRGLIKEANDALESCECRGLRAKDLGIYLDRSLRSAQELGDVVDELYLFLMESGLWEEKNEENENRTEA